MTRIKSTYLAVLVVLLSPTAANAVPILTSVGDYEVSTVTGTFSDLSVLLMDQVWWGDGNLALEFTGLVQDSLGLLNVSSTIGPLFTYSITTAPMIFSSAWCGPGNAFSCVGAAIFFDVSTSNTFTWAVAESVVSVPEPGTLALLGIGLFGMGLARRRKKV